MHLALRSTCNQMWALRNHMWEWKQSQGPFSENHLPLDHMVSTLESGSKGIPAFCNLQADRMGDMLRDTVNYPGGAEPELEVENRTSLSAEEEILDMSISPLKLVWFGNSSTKVKSVKLQEIKDSSLRFVWTSSTWILTRLLPSLGTQKSFSNS